MNNHNVPVVPTEDHTHDFTRPMQSLSPHYDVFGCSDCSLVTVKTKRTDPVFQPSRKRVAVIVKPPVEPCDDPGCTICRPANVGTVGVKWVGIDGIMWGEYVEVEWETLPDAFKFLPSTEIVNYKDA